MSADAEATEGNGSQLPTSTVAPIHNGGGTMSNAAEEDEEEEEDDDDEPELKYAKLTGNLAGVYRNADSTSAFVVAGDKMVVGTHSGNVHVLSLPGLQSLRSYRAHNATTTSVSVSPTPPAPSTVKTEGGGTQLLSAAAPTLSRTTTSTTLSPRTQPTRQQNQAPTVPNTPSNQIYIATSSLDGHVCISSLTDPKDVQLRNFARPVNAVALSPDYKNDRTFLSGGLAGQLLLTVGGKAGVSSDANTNSAAAAASGWLGSIGLGTNTGKDTVLHSGEGTISTVKWSLSGKWVCWVNEEGIKIMRAHLKLGSESSEDAWRRIAHAAKPNRKGWVDMAGVWKARAEWVDEGKLEVDHEEVGRGKNGVVNGGDAGKVEGTTSAKKKKSAKYEKLVVGWGDTAWILHVHEGGTSHGGQRQVGSADIVHKLQFRDCVVSGISLYTPTLLAILAYRTRDDDDKPIETVETSPKHGRQRARRTGLPPQLRLVNVVNGEEVDLDELSSISRFETLSAQDYYLGTLHMPRPLPEKANKEQQRGALEAVWEASGGGYASRLFNSSASVMSGSSSGRDEKTPAGTSFTSPSRSGSYRGSGVTPTPAPTRRPADTAHPCVTSPGLKLFIQSPYDCVLAIKRDLSDHLDWLLDHSQYAQAWQLIDDNPSVVNDSTSTTSNDRQQEYSEPATPTPSARANDTTKDASLASFFADSDSQTTASASHPSHPKPPSASSPAEKEKRRIADLWLQQLVAREHWSEAGRVAGRVLGTSSRWEHWVWTFAQADRFDEITPYIPSTATGAGEGEEGEVVQLPSLVYELVLGHYIQTDPARVKELLDLWLDGGSAGVEGGVGGLFDVRSVVAAIEKKLQLGEGGVREGEGEWRMLVECLAKLCLVDGRPQEALRWYFRSQNAEAAMALIKGEEGKAVADAVAEDVAGLLMLRVSAQQLRFAPLHELEEASREAVDLLVEKALRGSVMPDTVIRQIERRREKMRPFLYFYLRALWHGGAPDPTPPDDPEPEPQSWKPTTTTRLRSDQLRLAHSRALVQDHADLAVQLFGSYASFDRPLLTSFLQTSDVYNYERAAALCEKDHYIPELVHILSKTGQTKRALSLIIGEIGDVSAAIAFAKANGELWDDLLDYSMSKPRFIRGLLEEVGTAIEPSKLVRRIPEGLEVEGLKEGILRLVREFEVQVSISEGVARVLRGEVVGGMEKLRWGRARGVRFEVFGGQEEEGEWEGRGRCRGCEGVFGEDEKDPLLAFPCGHVYHLPCLLRALPNGPDERTIERVLRQLRSSNEDEGSGVRSVGAKVAHAHIIKNLIKGGCPECCVVPEGN